MATQTVAERSVFGARCRGVSCSGPYRAKRKEWADERWYFFTPNQNAPKPFVWGQDYAVLVGVDEDTNEYGFNFGAARFAVNDVKGMFAGPLVAPSFEGQRRPRQEGFYFFRSGDDSPPAFAADTVCVVRVEFDARTETHWAVLHGQRFRVDAMGGVFSAVVIPPSLDF